MPPNPDVIHESQLISEEPEGTNYPQSWPLGRERPLVWPSACCSHPRHRGCWRGRWRESVEMVWVGGAGFLGLMVSSSDIKSSHPDPEQGHPVPPGLCGGSWHSQLLFTPCVAWTARHVLTTCFSGSICAHCSASALMGLTHSGNIISFL